MIHWLPEYLDLAQEEDGLALKSQSQDQICEMHSKKDLMLRMLEFFQRLFRFYTVNVGISAFIVSLSSTSHAVYSTEIVNDPRLLNAVVQVGNIDFNCTGFLIDKYSVVTAAHCIGDGETRNDPTAIFQFGGNGDKIRNALPIGYTMSSMIVMPGEDIGLVFPFSPDGTSRFNDAVPFEIEKPENLTVQDEICVVGIGESAEIQGAQPLKIRCGLRASVGPGGVMFIVDPKREDQINGPGDSGGPILKKLPDGNYKVIGIISMGPRKEILSPYGLSTIGTSLIEGPGRNWLDKKGFPLKY